MNDFKKWQSKNPNNWFSCKPGYNGFMPIREPLDKLPDKYDCINDIIEKMPKLISENNFVNYVSINLQQVIISENEDESLLAALQRDYTFIASAYALESSHNNLTNGVYGKARTLLPKVISIPLKKISDINKVNPWLDYAYGYGLNNAKLISKTFDPCNYKSYKTIRMFTGSDSESGFINIHVAMVSQSGELLKYQQNILESLAKKDKINFNLNLKLHYKIFYHIIDILQMMWKASKKSEYLTFRTFIMGQKGNNKCFENEKICFELENGNKEYHSYRGETGAQDSIIPSIDNLFLLKYPKNRLTEYLFDLRKYRPKDHQEYLDFVKFNSEKYKFKEYVFSDIYSSFLLLKNLNILRLFRAKHWNLTKKYIIENTKHPVATGGTPITTWLPNQLGSTILYMEETINKIDLFLNQNKDNSFEENLDEYNSLKIAVIDHKIKLINEVNNLQKDFENQESESVNKLLN